MSANGATRAMMREQLEQRANQINALSAALDGCVKALERLANASAIIGNCDYTGGTNNVEDWAELWASNCQARAALEAAKKVRG